MEHLERGTGTEEQVLEQSFSYMAYTNFCPSSLMRVATWSTIGYELHHNVVHVKRNTLSQNTQRATIRCNKSIKDALSGLDIHSAVSPLHTRPLLKRYPNFGKIAEFHKSPEEGKKITPVEITEVRA